MSPGRANQNRLISVRLLSQPQFLGLGLALVLLAAIALASYFNWNEYSIAADETRQSRALVNQLKDLSIDLEAAESGQRGYLLTGNPEYLDSYNAAVPEILARLSALNSAQGQKLRPRDSVRELQRVVQEKLDELQRTIDVKRAGDTAAALALVNTNQGRLAMNRIRQIAQALEREQETRLNHTRDRSRYYARLSQLTTTLGASGVFVVILFAAVQIHRLISTRNRLNAELARFGADFQHLADCVPQMVWRTGPDGALEYVNQRWMDFSGLSPDAPMAHEWERLIHAKDRKNFLQQWRAALQNRTPLTAECRLRDRLSQRYRWFLFRATPVTNESASTVLWYCTYTDINEQKEIEAALQRTNEDLQQFVYSASHDLQEPLRTLMIYSEMIARRHTELFDDKDRTDLRILRESAERMRTLVADLSAYTDIAASEAEQNTTVNATEILERCLANLESSIQETGAHIRFNGLPQLAIPETHLLQLFQNLLSNALKYRKPGVAPEIDLDAKREDGEWIISVKDNGIGIDPIYHTRIFGLFKRLHAAHQYSGTGLGLAICKKIVERHRGRIWVESQAGAGATFFFSLPADPPLSFPKRGGQ